MNLYQIALVLLCGPPGVGKSTFKAKLTDCITSGLVEHKDLAIVSISYDELMDKCLESYLINEAPNNTEEEEEEDKTNCNNSNIKSKSKWKQGRSFIFKLISYLVDYLNTAETYLFSLASFIQNKSVNFSDFNLIAENFIKCVQVQLENVSDKNHFLILLDDLMYFESMRLPFYRLAVSKNCGYFVYCLRPVNLEFLLSRNHNRCSTQQLSETIVTNIHEKIEWPKNDWEKEFSHLEEVNSNDLASLRIPIALELILNGLSRFDIHLKCLNAKKTAQEKSVLANNRNIYYESDLLLRKLVATRLASAQTGEDKSSLAKLLSKRKADLLAQLRTKETSNIYSRLMECSNELELENELKTRLFLLSQTNDKQSK